jgi:uncharacterized protein (TIGR03083 family)
MLAGLSPEQLWQPSLCTGWTVHDIAAHWVSYLRFGQAKLYLGMLLTAADMDEVNRRLTRWEARRSSQELIDLLRRRATSRVTMPRLGYDTMLTEMVLHDLDIRVPLGIVRETPEERLRLAFDHLTITPAPGFGVGSRLAGLRLVATDTGWAHGAGAPVRGPAEAVLLAAAGRTAGFAALAGDGVPILRERLAAQTRLPAGRRVASTLAMLVRPPGRTAAIPG